MKKVLCVMLLVAFQSVLPGVVDATKLDSTNPQNNQINVANSASISATFDTLMNEETFSDTTFLIYSFLTGKLGGLYSISKDSMTVTFDPDSLLLPGETIRAMMTTSVTSAGGTPLDTAYVWSFTIETADNGDSLYHGPLWMSTTLNATCCVALGDYDNDGDLDLACGNSVGPTTGSTTIYRNDGGVLTGDPVWSSSVYPAITRGIAWGDYDGDGDLDLACGNQNDPNMIHRNDSGTLTTSPVWSSTAANTTYGIAWGDYDGDGDLDLACANFGQANTIYRNDDGTLTTNPVWSSTPTEDTKGVAWGDYDDDGDLDLACANYYSQNALYRNDGGILTTDPVWSPLSSGGATSVAWGDYDGDGDLDLAFGYYNGGANIYRNDAGTLTTTGVWGTMPAHDTYSIAWGDYDGDGDLDLACGNELQPNTVYRNQGGTLDSNPAWSSDSTFRTHGVAWGDLDGDGDLELACGNYFYFINQPNTVYYNVIVSEPELISTDPVSNSVDVLRDANVEATFNEAMASSTIVDTTFVVHSYQSGHMTGIYSMTDNDSTAIFNPDSLFHAGEVIEAVVTTDIESALETPLDEPYVWRFTVETVDNGDSLYRWPYWLSNSTARAYSSAWGDYDNDGDLDLAFGYIDEPSEIYRNDGGYLTKDPVWTAAQEDSTICIAWGDCDGDGDLDLACGNGGRSNTIYRNDNGILTSSPVWSSTPANDTREIAWGDYDGDGDLDLACGNSAGFGGDTTNTIYRNDGGLLTADPVWNSTSTYYTESVAWGDYDGDGDLDLACGNWNGANTLYRNDDGTLTTDPVWSSVEELPTSSVAWGDYDGDGDIDLACGNYNQSNGIYRNDAGTLTSSAAWTSTPNLNTHDIAWGDVDGDGDLDLACGNFGEANVIYFNGGGTIATNPTWGTIVTYMTIDIAWGDVDGDGDLELACANYFNEPNTVYYRITVPAPGLISTDPVVNSQNINRDANVQATFNQKMALESFTDTSFVVQSFQTGQLDGTYSMTNSETTAVFNPDSLLHAGEVVEATLTDGIASRVGTRLDPHYVWRFTVESINNGDSMSADAVWVSTTYNYTSCVAWVDYDNDGDLDLACGTKSDAQLGDVYRNDGGILTDDPVVHFAGYSTYSFAWGDYDGDGDLDLALANYNSEPNIVQLNNNGIFGYPPYWYSNPTNNTTSVACGDYDRDGDLDLAFGNVGASNTVYRNDNGTFTADPVWTSTPVCSTRCVAWGDYDNDGDLDLVCANSGAGETCNLYRNDGGWLTGNPVWSGPASAVTYSIAWGDYNGDGFIDLACGNYAGQNRVYHNDLGGGFTESWVSTPIASTNSVSWADYDGDGDLDLSCCNHGQPEVIYRNDSGTLTSNPVWSTNEEVCILTRDIAWGDFDGDGDLDLAVGSESHRADKVYRSGYAVRSTDPASNALDIDLSTDMEAQFTYALNPPTVSGSSFTAYGHLSGAMTGSVSTHSGDLYAVLDPDSVFHTGEVVEAVLTNAVTSSTGEPLVHSHVWRFNIEVPAADSLLPQPAKSILINNPHAIAWGDYDHDGDLDLACAANDVVLYRNDGGVLSMTPVWSVHPLNPVDIAWGDYDRDGDLDLACANRTLTGTYNTLYRNDGDSLTSDPVWTSSDASKTIAIAWGDCNGDGYLDLAFVNEPGVIDMGIYFNEGGTLSEDPFYDVFSGIGVDIAWGDYDNDGDLDLATAASGRNYIYRNEGGRFNRYDNQVWLSQPSNYSSCVAWGDYDGDGDLDLAFANGGQSNTVYENEGGTFSQYPEWSSVPTNNSYCVEWIDYDGDGDLDLAFGNYDQPNTIYLNEDSRLKTTPTWSSVPSNKTDGMNCGDFDGDGDMDLAFSNYNDNAIVIYLNWDIWDPSPVVDLAVVSTTDSSVVLSWTATGDDSTVGTASCYDIRYSNSLITAGNFYSADTVAGEPDPQGAGSPETFEVTGLVSGLKYYFALKAGDVDNNWSDISNCVSALTDLGAPVITAVKDIPNDQGKRVIVSWNRSETDYNYGVEEQYIVTEYSLWRMVDGLSMMSPRERNRLLREIEWIQENAPGKETKTSEPAVEKFPTAKTEKQPIVEHPIDTGKDTAPQILKSEQEFKLWYPVRFNAPLVDVRFEGLLSPGTWLYIASIPALQFESYASEASTYADSTGQGVPYFTFMVSAMTDDPFNHVESVPDSGYSVDNLNPCPPQNLVLVEPNTISWDPNQEEDLNFYSIYAGTESGFEPNPESHLGSTSDTSYALPDSIDGYYVFVTAVDYNGNESGPSNEIRYVTGIEEDLIPMAFALYQNVPNPFNPTTMIRFDLPRPVHVKLSVYNVNGELVATIVDEHMEEGRKEIAWTAKDKRGRAVSSGIYFYRLVAGDFVQTKKMVLLR